MGRWYVRLAVARNVRMMSVMTAVRAAVSMRCGLNRRPRRRQRAFDRIAHLMAVHARSDPCFTHQTFDRLAERSILTIVITARAPVCAHRIIHSLLPLLPQLLLVEAELRCLRSL